MSFLEKEMKERGRSAQIDTYSTRLLICTPQVCPRYPFRQINHTNTHTHTHTHTHTQTYTHSCINFHVLFFREVAIIFVSFGTCRLCRNVKWSFSYERKLTLSNYIFNLKWLNLYHRKWNLFERKERENDDIIYKKIHF